MKIEFHGAAREVGRSGVLIEDGNKRILLDYGIKLGEDKNEVPMPVSGYVDAVILSHAHLDHCGEIPSLFVKSEQPVFMTPPTIPLARMLIEDGLKVSKLKGIKSNYSESHVKRMMRNIIPVPYKKQRSIYDVELTFQDAGHILGSASTELVFNDKKVVYSGDVKYEETRLHKPGFQKFKDVDVLIIESTYGNRLHEPREKTEKEFVESCREVLDDGGNVVVPAFAVGRSQEILTVLNENHFDYPVYLDGMGKAVAEVMMEFPEHLKDYDSFYKAMKKAEWVYSSRQRDKALKEPSVVVSTAGMLSGGPIMNYLLKMKGLARKAIFFSGYQVEGTPGRKLLETGRLTYMDYDLNFKDFEVKKFDFSAHTDKKGLINLVKKVNPNLVLLNHGSEESEKELKKELTALDFEVKSPKFGQTIKV